MSGKADPSNWVLSNAPIGSASYLLPTSSSHPLPTALPGRPQQGRGSGSRQRRPTAVPRRRGRLRGATTLLSNLNPVDIGPYPDTKLALTLTRAIKD